MSKFLKFTGVVLGIVLLLLALAVAVLVTLVSPNRLKPIMMDQVKKHTGREFVIDGDLSWSFFPYLGVKAGHLSLGNPSEFTQKIFVEFDGAMSRSKVYLNGVYVGEWPYGYSSFSFELTKFLQYGKENILNPLDFPIQR